MKRKNRLFAAILCLMLLLSFTACTSANPTQAPASPPAATEKPAATEAPTAAPEQSAPPSSVAIEPYSGPGGDLTIWGDWSGNDAKEVDLLVSRFNDKNPSIKAVYTYQENFTQKLLTSIAAGTPPDALLWDRYITPLYASKGALYAIDDLVVRDQVDTSLFYSEAIKELTYDGKLYGLPLDVDNRCLFYNKEIFREVGLDPNKPPTTWDELEQAAIKCTIWNGNTLERSGFALTDTGLFSSWILQAGGSMIDANGKSGVNTPAGRAVLDFWSKLLFTDKVYTVGFASNLWDAQDPFVTGMIAMKLDGPWTIPNIKKYAPYLDFGTAPMPAGPNGDRGCIMGGFSFAIANQTKNVDLAWQFVKWYAADTENDAYFASVNGDLPANITSAQKDIFLKDPLLGAFVENMKNAKIRPSIPGYSQYEGDGVNANLQLFVSGQISEDECLKKAEEMGNQILAQNAGQ
jgi:multiple sugar transport system substrate-binding protein